MPRTPPREACLSLPPPTHPPGSINLLLQPGQGPAHHKGPVINFALRFYSMYQSLSDTKTSCGPPAEEKLPESSGFSALK